MKEEKMIEQVFKDAFEGFAPDVPPKVWGSISGQLAHPAVPQAQPSGAVAKVAAGKLGAASSWIIGGITASVITAGVLVYGYKEMAKIETMPAVITTVAEISADNHSAVQSANTLNVKKQMPLTMEAKKPGNGGKMLDNKGAIANVPGLNEKEIAGSGTNESNNNGASVSTPDPNSFEGMNAAAKENEKTAAEKEELNSFEKNNTAPENVPPLILINSTAGFAPLQVACLLNKEGINGDWDFGDGNVQLNTNNTTHKYTKPGIYTLQCATGESVMTKTIEVIGHINTAFSPNGDGINDDFYIDAKNLDTFSLNIFDRNGNTIAALNNANEKWDGRTKNGDSATSGTYFYELSATTMTGKEIRQRGSVNLFR